MTVLLEVSNISKRFGGLQAADDVSFMVNEGEIVGLIGPNGAGKSTVFNLVNGIYRPDAGRVVFAGVDITGEPPYRIARHGVARGHQIVQPLAGLTVLDNCTVGACFGRENLALGPAREAARAAAEMVGLGDRLNALAGSLTTAGKKRLELARALAARPRAALAGRGGRRPQSHRNHAHDRDRQRDPRGRGDDPHDRAHHARHNDAVKPHRGAQYRTQAGGRLAPRGRQQSRSHHRLSRRLSPLVRSGASAVNQEMLLQVEGLEAGYGDVRVVWGVSLAVARGSVTTLVGANGAGKTTSLRAITGLIRPQGGRVLFNGEDVTRLPAHAKTARGLVLVPEGRQLFTDMSVEENLEMGAFAQRAHTRFDVQLRQVFSLFPRLQERRRQKAGTFSGGEQQMLAIGRGLMSCPDILIIDELSLGLAPVVVQQLGEVLRALRASGVTILLVEQNVHLALTLSDYAYVIAEGRPFIEGPADRIAAMPEIRQAYLGI